MATKKHLPASHGRAKRAATIAWSSFIFSLFQTKFSLTFIYFRRGFFFVIGLVFSVRISSCCFRYPYRPHCPYRPLYPPRIFSPAKFFRFCFVCLYFDFKKLSFLSIFLSSVIYFLSSFFFKFFCEFLFSKFSGISFFLFPPSLFRFVYLSIDGTLGDQIRFFLNVFKKYFFSGFTFSNCRLRKDEKKVLNFTSNASFVFL